MGSMTWTDSLLAYGMVITAITFGAALGYRRGHRAVTVFLGPVVGLCLILISYTLLSDHPTSTLSDTSWDVTLQADAIGFIVFYVAAFGFAALAGVILHQRDNTFG